ncbi:hypothetical protein CAPTEDRAFT_128680, partial [Capitella teleta]
LTRWFYKAVKGKCAEFIYKRQDGNGNNFINKKNCEAACKNTNVPGMQLNVQEFRLK